MTPHRRRILVLIAAAAVPLAIALVFPHPTDRPVLPESFMLVTVVALTFAGGIVAGLIAAVASTLALWFFNVPEANSFAFDSNRDRFVVATGRFVGTDPGSGTSHDVAHLVRVDSDRVDATIRGTAADLDAWLWRRTEQGATTLTGSEAALAAFRTAVDQPID